MTENQEKAWDCLTEQEQQLLFLSLSQGLSSREAGSILKISHYKLLEHKARAERLFKLFSDYLFTLTLLITLLFIICFICFIVVLTVFYSFLRQIILIYIHYKCI